VETHITNILNKLCLNSRVQLSRWIAELPETTRS
jgi:DNA-binding NarL/FixJ family response regulator